jgi:hypothetical protein
MLTCKFCILTKGFRLSDKDRIFDTDEHLAEHLENVHGQPVMREGETEEQAVERCAKKGIVPDRTKCKCKDCAEEREKQEEREKEKKKAIRDYAHDLSRRGFTRRSD